MIKDVGQQEEWTLECLFAPIHDGFQRTRFLGHIFCELNPDIHAFGQSAAFLLREIQSMGDGIEHGKQIGAGLQNSIVLQVTPNGIPWWQVGSGNLV